MRIEAIWTIALVRGDTNSSGGVLVFENGRVFGGDSDFYYIGHYAINKGRVSLRITVHPYREDTPLDTVFDRRSKFDVELAGQIEDSQMVLVGAIFDEPEQTITVIAKRRHEIPDLSASEDLASTR